MPADVLTLDTHYAHRDDLAAAYLLTGGDEVAFVETNTALAVPRLLEALRRAGKRPEDVRYIAITHIHLDHAGGAGPLMQACPNATLLAHPLAATHAIDPSRIEAGARQVYGEAFDALYGEIVPVPEGRVHALGDGETVMLGDRPLVAWHTAGHAKHHLVLHDPDADTVYTGDSFGLLYPSLQAHGPFVVPSTTPTDFDPEAAHASVDRIAGLGTRWLHPTHFGRHAMVPALADQLHRLIAAHAAVVDQADAAGLDGDALDGACVDAVTRLFDEALSRHGFAGDAEAASQLRFDAELNAQGLAFAVRKRRFKRAKASGHPG